MNNWLQRMFVVTGRTIVDLLLLIAPGWLLLGAFGWLREQHLVPLSLWGVIWLVWYTKANYHSYLSWPRLVSPNPKFGTIGILMTAALTLLWIGLNSEAPASDWSRLGLLWLSVAIAYFCWPRFAKHKGPALMQVISYNQGPERDAFNREIGELTRDELERVCVEGGVYTPAAAKSARRDRLEISAAGVAWHKYFAAYRKATGRRSALDNHYTGSVKA